MLYKLTTVTRAYLFLLLLLLPVDYFAPTAALLREGGAKPALPLMIIGSAYLIIRHWRSYLLKMDACSYWLGLLFLGIGILGSIAFGLNLCFSWSFFGGGKNPLAQFLAQGVLYALLPVIVLTHADLFRRRPGCVPYLLKVLPAVVVIHLSILSLEAAGWLRGSTFPLSLFRVPDSYVGGRVTGLMTEPSYVGAMAAMYGLSLILLRETRTRFRVFLGITLFGIALAIGAKTVVPVMIAGGLGYMWQIRAKILSVKTILTAVVVAAISFYVVLMYSALDVSENLSSAMRLGSTILALRVAWHGYAITGIGFGQFHFFYRSEFAPQYLFYSQEALDQFSRDAGNRASTYNLFARYLVETGVLGLGLFLGAVVWLLRKAREHQQAGTQFGVVLLACSLGFLMTQDPYCYPPLACGMAVILSVCRKPVDADKERSV